MKNLFTLVVPVLCLISSVCLAQANNTLPEFGDGKFSAEQKEANDNFVKEVTAKAGSREKAAEHMLRLGFDAVQKQDFDTAVKRFNQSWLLTPKNPVVAWGFGIVSGQAGNGKKALEYFETAYKSLSKDVYFLNDFGLALIRIGSTISKSEGEFYYFADRSLKVLGEAIQINPSLENSYANQAIAFYMKKDGASAWKSVTKARELGGKTLDPKFVEDLSKFMPEPK